MKKNLLNAAFVVLAPMPGLSASAAAYDLVINNGRVMDPETIYDAIVNVGELVLDAAPGCPIRRTA